VPTRVAPSGEAIRVANEEGAPQQEGTRFAREPSEADQGTRASDLPARHHLYPALAGAAQTIAAAAGRQSSLGDGPGRAVAGPDAHRTGDLGAHRPGSAESDADAGAN
jgi:hypothetical protein